MNLSYHSIRSRTHEPDYSNLPHMEYNWERMVYSGAMEVNPDGILEPLGKYVVTTCYVDAKFAS